MMKNQLSKAQLLRYIDEVSFCVVDMTLYCDTHPDDEEAIAFCQENIRLRKEALDEYARLYGPLTVDYADRSSSGSWDWVNQPWPWEPTSRRGGRC